MSGEGVPWVPVWTVRGDEAFCQHGTAADVHCCNCHHGFLFKPWHCQCKFDLESKAMTKAEAVARMVHAIEDARSFRHEYTGHAGQLVNDHEVLDAAEVEAERLKDLEAVGTLLRGWAEDSIGKQLDAIESSRG